MSSAPTSLPVSLVIPAYRAEQCIERAIASVADAAAVPGEIIVVDDASDDRTAERAEAAGATVLRRPRNGGPSAARNAGVAAARFPWIAFLDADDVWLNGKLAAQWEAIERWPDAGFCFTDYDVIDAEGAVQRNETVRDAGFARLYAEARAGDVARYNRYGFVPGLIRSMFIRQSSAIVRRDVFLHVGGYDESLRLGEDYDLFLRLIGAAPALFLARVYVMYVRQPHSLSADRLAEIRAIDALWTRMLERPSRYPRIAIERVTRHRAEPLRSGCRIALRLGRFADARVLARRAQQLERVPSMTLLAQAADALDNPAGYAAYAAVRNAWRRWRSGEPLTLTTSRAIPHRS